MLQFVYFYWLVIHSTVLMNSLEIITKKRNNFDLTAEEIDYFVQGYSLNHIPDYQMAAFLMAVFFQGMSFEETASLTTSMLHSGDVLNFNNVDGYKVDKHSTGGVGDKVSLVLAPLVAAAGLKVPMISGRGLGHSGGTLDKLESIPGFRTSLSTDEFYQQVSDLGVAMIGQTERIVPADRKMYSLRDTTATVESIPLITGSILSKKLAEGINGLVLDVKTGTGAFMRRYVDALALADSLIKTAELNGLRTTALITSMDQPLGNTAGNWLETKEAIEVLQGKGPEDMKTVTLILAAHMLLMAGVTDSEEAAIDSLHKLIDNGQAFIKFCQMVESQGGDVDYVLNTAKYPAAHYSLPIKSLHTGYISELEAKKIGLAVVHLGGGREVVEDQIDYGAGVVLFSKVGDFVKEGQEIAILYSDDEKALEKVEKDVLKAYSYQNKPPESQTLIHKILQNNVPS